MSPGIVVTPTTPFHNAEGTAGFKTILKHTTLFVVAAAEQHRNVLQYGSNINIVEQLKILVNHMLGSTPQPVVLLTSLPPGFSCVLSARL